MPRSVNTLGSVIKHHRIIKALSRRELAAQLGVSERCIVTWELGERKPKLDNIQKMAKIFKIKVEELTQYL